MSTGQHRLLTALAMLCLLASVAIVGLGEANRRLQAEVNQRQQYLQQSAQLEGLYREMARSLAELATRHGDAELSALLQRHGISWTPAATPSAEAAKSTPLAPPSAAKPGGRK